MMTVSSIQRSFCCPHRRCKLLEALSCALSVFQHPVSPVSSPPFPPPALWPYSEGAQQPFCQTVGRAGLWSPLLGFAIFQTGLELTVYVAQSGLRLSAVLLPRPPKWWDYRGEPPSPPSLLPSRVSLHVASMQKQPLSRAVGCRLTA